MNSISSHYMDKRITDLSQSNSRTRSFFDDDDDEEDLLHSFDFPPILTQHLTPDPIYLHGRSSTAGTCSGDRNEASLGALIVSEINLRIKEHMDTLLHAVGGINVRLSQVETRNRQLDNAVDGLKYSIEFNHGRTEGKLRDLQNTLHEVRGGIRDLRDKQDIAEAQLQLAMLKGLSFQQQQSGEQKSSIQSSSPKEVPSIVPRQSHELLPISLSAQHFGAPPTLPSTLAAAATAPLLPTHLSQNTSPLYWHTEFHHSPSWFAPEMKPLSPILHQPPSQLSPHIPTSREYLLPPLYSSVSSRGSSFSEHPTVRMLPRALPTAAPVDNGASSGESGNKVRIDDVVDRVVAMGFRRDLVRTLVKKLTENGQSVDLNIVLDKLINGGNG